MIVDVIGSKFSVDCDPHQINKIIFAHVRAFMEQNEYFHEEHFLETLEEDDDFEVAEAMSPAAAIITISQLEDWVDEAAVTEDEETDEAGDALEADDPDTDDDEDDIDDDDDEE
jgi:hypothetical protein